MNDPLPQSQSCGNSHCPRCGAAFTCDLARGKKTCWCAALPNILSVPAAGGGCLCPACLATDVRDKGEGRERIKDGQPPGPSRADLSPSIRRTD